MTVQIQLPPSSLSVYISFLPSSLSQSHFVLQSFPPSLFLPLPLFPSSLPPHFSVSLYISVSIYLACTIEHMQHICWSIVHRECYTKGKGCLNTKSPSIMNLA